MPDAVVPFVWQPRLNWSRNDGNWSTFSISVGTPAQTFHVFPSTVGAEVWIPMVEGCSQYAIVNCGAVRGVLPFDGAPSSGFQPNESSSWQEIGIYSLGLEESLYGPDDSGLYGLDVVALGSSGASFTQTIAGFATSNFWLGVLGLGVVPAAFDVKEQNVEGVLTTMVDKSLIPSQSYGYSAGAAYRSAAGGIVLGGYDQSAFTPSNVNFDLYFSGSRSLTASLRGVVVSNSLQGTVSLPTGPYNMSIDSTISQLWLPRAMCDSLEEFLGLSYDDATQLTNVTTTIELPYAAFDQQLDAPLFENQQRYFPMKRGANGSQFVLGRAFLQEAYIVTDWTRQSFTIGQSLHHNGVSNNIMPILPESPSDGLSTAAIAGIAVGAVVAIGICCIVGWWTWRHRKQARANSTAEHGTLVEEYPEDEKQVEEVEGRRNWPFRHERLMLNLTPMSAMSSMMSK
ncbi:Putative aspartic peptidase A1 family, aspartic peptidase domain superfamily [Septoria linicola]|uniref:Aspartic peptidase A1 family, aspartic peptidase domain superfamily n=1 Tax=Septoria linicola TaxID=215465 RepID=A0A9Q9AJ97_9PEZI|nr:Putative aspartic peptidase A1 family, aspartic peptidase domain superfamily [Septoria linicola]